MAEARFLRRFALPVALVISGFGATAVEVLWQRMLVPQLGGSTAALTAVLAAYMGGLALGAALAARGGDALDPPRALRLYAMLEVLIFVATLAISSVLAAMPAGVAAALGRLPEGSGHFWGRFCLAFAVMVVPATALGATLPLAVRAAVGGATRPLLGGSGLLYSANTAGAVLGALAGPLILLPHLGLRRATMVAAAGNLLAGLIARAGHVDADISFPAAQANGEDVDDPGFGAPWVLAASAACGATALGFEVLWTRTFGTIAGSTAHAFGVVLAMVLAGVALGAGAASFAGRRLHRGFGAGSALAGLAIAGSVLAVVLLPLVDRAPVRFASLAAAGRLTFGSSLSTLLSVGAAVILPPAACFGAALPLAIRGLRSRAWPTARAAGWVCAANTLGALAGAAATGLWLVPAVGPDRVGKILSALPAIAGACLWLRGAYTRRSWRLALSVAPAATLAAFAIVFAPNPSSAIAAAGAHDLRTQLPVNVVYHRDGPESSVLVESVGSRRTFFVAGRPEASTAWFDVRAQYLLGHLPALLAGGVRRGLVVGLGSGMTAGALAQHGEVWVAELNRAVPGAAAQFRDFNHDVLAKVRLVIEDGRVVLAGGGMSFEVVTTDPIHPYVAGSAALYTTEYFRLSRDRLEPHGAASIWLPLHQMGLDELRAVIGSFVDVFPDAELYVSHGNAVLLGGGSGAPRTASARVAQLRAGWTPAIAADMRLARIGSPEELAEEVVAGPDALARFAAGARRNRDDDPWIELSLPLYIYRDTRARNLEALLALREPGQAATSRGRAFEATQRSALAPEPAEALDLLRSTLVGGQSPLLEHEMLIREVSATLAKQLWNRGEKGPALALARTEAAHPQATIESLLGVEEILRAASDWPAVDAVNLRIQRQWPARPEGHLRHGEALARRGRFLDATTEIERGIALDPFGGFAAWARPLLGRSYLMTGRSTEADRLLRAGASGP